MWVDIYGYGWMWMDVHVCPWMYVDVFEKMDEFVQFWVGDFPLVFNTSPVLWNAYSIKLLLYTRLLASFL